MEEMSKEEIITTINDIKQDVLNTRNKIIYNSNRELINLYFRIGKTISQKSSYGKNFVKNKNFSCHLASGGGYNSYIFKKKYLGFWESMAPEKQLHSV